MSKLMRRVEEIEKNRLIPKFFNAKPFELKSDLRNRIGRIRLSDELVRGNPDLYQEIISKVIPYCIKTDPEFECIEIYCHHKEFDVLSWGDDVPMYSVSEKHL